MGACDKLRRKPAVYDFVFNGWGMKFAANYDNAFANGVNVVNMQQSKITSAFHR